MKEYLEKSSRDKIKIYKELKEVKWEEYVKEKESYQKYYRDYYFILWPLSNNQLQIYNKSWQHFSGENLGYGIGDSRDGSDIYLANFLYHDGIRPGGITVKVLCGKCNPLPEGDPTYKCLACSMRDTLGEKILKAAEEDEKNAKN